MLEEFCKKNGIRIDKTERIIELYNDIEKHVDKHNDNYIASALIKEKDYLDSVLKPVDPVIVLDDDQRRVVLTDEDYCLV